MTYFKDWQEATQKYVSTLPEYDEYYENGYCQSNYDDLRKAFFAGCEHGAKSERERVLGLLRSTDDEKYEDSEQKYYLDVGVGLHPDMWASWLENELEK